MRFGKTISVQYQPDHHLLAIGPLVARVAPFGLWVSLGLPFEIGRCQIVQIERVIEVEQRLFSFGKLPLDLFSIRVKRVQVAVKRILVELRKVLSQDVCNGGAPNPIRHGMFGERKN